MSTIQEMMHINDQLNTLRFCQSILSKHLDRTTLNEAQEKLVDEVMKSFNYLANSLNIRIDEIGKAFEKPAPTEEEEL